MCLFKCVSIDAASVFTLSIINIGYCRSPPFPKQLDNANRACLRYHYLLTYPFIPQYLFSNVNFRDYHFVNSTDNLISSRYANKQRNKAVEQSAVDRFSRIFDCNFGLNFHYFKGVFKKEFESIRRKNITFEKSLFYNAEYLKYTSKGSSDVIEASKQYDCDAVWPDLELFLPIHIIPEYQDQNRRLEWENIFMYSLLTFWPLKLSRMKLNVHFDQEDIHSAEYANIQRNLSSYQQYFFTNHSIVSSFNSFNKDIWHCQGYCIYFPISRLPFNM